ncbi:hypothetical protein ScPMuIL_011468 [Solemya velum]
MTPIETTDTAPTTRPNIYTHKQKRKIVEIPSNPTEDTPNSTQNNGSESSGQPQNQHRKTVVKMTDVAQEDDGQSGLCYYLLLLISFLSLFTILPLCCAIKIVQEYERAVIFRLGRVTSGGAAGPGMFFLMPFLDSFKVVDMRTKSVDVPPQEILTRDSLTVAVDAVIYVRVFDAIMSVINVNNVNSATNLLAATTLRTVLGMKDMSEILSQREEISNTMQKILDEATDPWGVKVERVEIKDVRFPVQLQRAMAAEAEAARDARAKVVAAEGEQKASVALKMAADIISESPGAMQLRYLQTLNSIAAERNSTIIFPLPVEMLSHFNK